MSKSGPVCPVCGQSFPSLMEMVQHCADHPETISIPISPTLGWVPFTDRPRPDADLMKVTMTLCAGPDGSILIKGSGLDDAPVGRIYAWLMGQMQLARDWEQKTMKRGPSPPWTIEQVAKLNEFQKCGRMHPFTCGSGKRGDAPHSAYARARGEDRGQLLATVDGWLCPVCGYTQEWAHDFMFQGAPPPIPGLP